MDNNFKVFYGKAYNKGDDGVYKRVPTGMDEARDKSGLGDIQIEAISRGLTTDGKYMKCMLPIRHGGVENMAGFKVPVEKIDKNYESKNQNTVAFTVSGRDNIAATIYDDKCEKKNTFEVTAGDLKGWNEEARDFHKKQKEAEKENTAAYKADSVSLGSKIADTVPYGNGTEDSKSTLADKYPETQAMLNAKWDRKNPDAALGLSEAESDIQADFSK